MSDRIAHHTRCNLCFFQATFEDDFTDLGEVIDLSTT